MFSQGQSYWVGVFFLTLVTFGLEAQAAFRFQAGDQSIVFDDTESAALAGLLRVSVEPTRDQITQLLRSLPDETVAKLRALAATDLELDAFHDAKLFAQEHGLSSGDLATLRLWLFDEAARSVIQALAQDTGAQVRLIGRDMNEVYFRLEALLSPTNSELSLSVAEKEAIFKRVALVTLSRPLSERISSPAELAEALALNDAEIQSASRIHVLDIGYEGNILRHLAPHFGKGALGRKLQWNLIFRAENAPDPISEWRLTEFERRVEQKHPHLLRDGLLHRIPDSFRVRIIEHGPRWSSRSQGMIADPVYVMLDLDDTVLKEVDIHRFEKHEETQAITYRPSPGHIEKYLKRLSEPASPEKVIHYRFHPDGKTITGTVVARPGMTELFRELEPLIRSGKIKILATSANDPPRTQAMHEQFKIAGKTLKDWGVQYVHVNHFGVNGGQKSVAALRDHLSIPLTAPVIAIDDLAHKIVDFIDKDNTVSIPPWDQARAEAYLEKRPEAQVFSLQDLSFMKNTARLLRDKRYHREGSAWENRLRVLAQMVQIHSVEVPPRNQWEEISPDEMTLSKVLGAKPTRHRDLYPKWEDWKKGLIEKAAMTLELYDEHEIYGIERDGNWFIYAMALAAKDEKERLERLHLIDISTRTSSNDHTVKAYLNQKGITQAAFERGVNFLFVDVGYSGSITQRIRAHFEERFHPQIQTSFVIAGNGRHVSTRSFMASFGAEAVVGNAADYIPHIQELEKHLPKTHTKSHGYAEKGGQWVPVRYSKNNDFMDGELSPENHLRYVEDLAYFMQTSQAKKHLAHRRAQWRELRRLAKQRKDGKIIAYLKSILREEDGDPYSEGMVRDFIERHQDLVCDRDVGLDWIVSIAHDSPNLSGLAHRYPGWKEILLSPDRSLPELARTKQWRTLELLAWAVADHEFRRKIIDAIRIEPITREIEAILTAVMLPDRQGNRELLTYLEKWHFIDLSKPVAAWLMDFSLRSYIPEIVQEIELAIFRNQYQDNASFALFKAAFQRERSHLGRYLASIRSQWLRVSDCEKKLARVS